MSVSLTHCILPDSPATPVYGPPKPNADGSRPRKPHWIRAPLPGGAGYIRMRGIVDQHHLHTVCQSAACPNMGECWSRGWATFMILGNICTRSCGFCNVATGRPLPPDPDEPAHLAQAIRLMGVRYAVLTSVDRDELPDGGAGHWAETIRRVRQVSPSTIVETLIPDYTGRRLLTVLEARPDVLAHNLEVVPRISKIVRPQAKHERSLATLKEAKAGGLVTKTGLMLGLGETRDEVEAVIHEAVAAGVDILTLGQYLQPSHQHLRVERFVPPQEFAELKEFALQAGIKACEAGPMVRSSYYAENTGQEVLRLIGRPQHTLGVCS